VNSAKARENVDLDGNILHSGKSQIRSRALSLYQAGGLREENTALASITRSSLGGKAPTTLHTWGIFLC
jgi:hypothetical protein